MDELVVDHNDSMRKLCRSMMALLSIPETEKSRVLLVPNSMEDRFRETGTVVDDWNALAIEIPATVDTVIARIFLLPVRFPRVMISPALFQSFSCLNRLLLCVFLIRGRSRIGTDFTIRIVKHEALGKGQVWKIVVIEL